MSYTTVYCFQYTMSVDSDIQNTRRVLSKNIVLLLVEYSFISSLLSSASLFLPIFLLFFPNTFISPFLHFFLIPHFSYPPHHPEKQLMFKPSSLHPSPVFVEDNRKAVKCLLLILLVVLQGRLKRVECLIIFLRT